MQTRDSYFLGFDFGMKYIGVAIGQKVTRTASPLTTLTATDGIPAWAEVMEIITTWHPCQLIVGLPLNMDGSEQPITFCARRFANRLKARYDLPVAFVDERLTTWEAKQRLGRCALYVDNPTKKTLERLNAAAAVVLLEQWIDEQSPCSEKNPLLGLNQAKEPNKKA